MKIPKLAAGKLPTAATGAHLKQSVSMAGTGSAPSAPGAGVSVQQHTQDQKPGKGSGKQSGAAARAPAARKRKSDEARLSQPVDAAAKEPKPAAVSAGPSEVGSCLSVMLLGKSCRKQPLLWLLCPQMPAPKGTLP